jgi:ribose transport system ATP-binding protein
MNGSANNPRLSVCGLRKAFGANQVLVGLDLELAAGEVHALVGGNGAGKSTLSKIVAGLESRDAGELLLDGEPFTPANRRTAQADGVVMVLQELSVLPTLTVAENLFLGALPTRWLGRVDRPRLHAAARVALDRVGLGWLDPVMPAGVLGVGHQQLLEIAAGLAQECRLLILDEPTAALTGSEVATLFTLLRELRAQGVTILYISHRLDEIAALADRVSVLRDGQLVATLPARETPHEKLVGLMAGGAGEATTPGSRAALRTGLALQVVGICAGRAVRHVSLSVNRGEIVGLGGLVGAGRTELLRAIFGADHKECGEVLLGPDQRPLRYHSTGAAVARGMAFVPEDRKHHGIFARLNLRENLGVVGLPRWLPGIVDAAAERAQTDDVLARLQVRCTGPGQAIAELSGGNQQKLVIGRWLQGAVKVWLLDEPTRGVDVASRRAIHDLLRERAAAGEALLVASSDYEELAALCDRVLVLSNGRITGQFARADLDPEAFMAAAFAGFAPDHRTN